MKYFCTITKEGEWFNVNFPDVPNAITVGSSFDEALTMAADVLNGVLATDVSHGGTLPENQTGPGEGLFPIDVEPNILVASELRVLRGKASQSEVAKRLGMTYQTYQYLENPLKNNPTLKTLTKVAKVYGKDLEVHFG